MENARHDLTFPKKHVLFESGHVPPFPDVVRETLDWLDRYLGPVTPPS
jgi:hypothetical protein